MLGGEVGGLSDEFEGGVNSIGWFEGIGEAALSFSDFGQVAFGVDAMGSGDVDDARVFIVGWAVDGGIAGRAGEEFEKVRIGVGGDILEGEVIVEAGAASATFQETGGEGLVDPFFGLQGFLAIGPIDGGELIVDVMVQEVGGDFLIDKGGAKADIGGSLDEGL